MKGFEYVQCALKTQLLYYIKNFSEVQDSNVEQLVSFIPLLFIFSILSSLVLNFNYIIVLTFYCLEMSPPLISVFQK